MSKTFNIVYHSVVNSETPKERPLVIDLFSGAGGSSWGFLEAGFHIVGAIEQDENASETYENNLGVMVKKVDIRQLPPVTYRENLGLKRGELDVLMGCPPCQGFSRMRNSEGVGDRRNVLVMRYLEYIEEFMPRFAVFENVPGIIRTVHGKEYYEKLSGGLKKLGYRLVEKIENAADFGVGQIRRRVIVVGGRDGECPPFPQRTHGHPNSPEVIKGILLPWRSVKDVIGNGRYPPLNAGDNGEQEGKYPNHIAPATGKKVLEFIQMIPRDGGSRTDIPKDFWLPCHELHSGHNDVYGRLSWNKPSNTITTGCTNISKGRFVHPEQDRALTYREAAALQGFPDNFVFYGKRISTQIGNAVPPPLAYAIARELMTVLIPDRDNHKSI